MKRRMRRLSAGMLVLAAGCSGEGRIAESSPAGPLDGAVTRELGDAITSDGKLRSGALATAAPGEVTEDKARALAAAYPMQFGELYKPVLEAQHAGRLDLSAVRPCGTPRYAESSFEPIETSVDRAVRLMFGSWWIVPMCEGAQPAMIIAVSALATDLDVKDGRITFPVSHGLEFIAIGIPAGHAPDGYLAPERAIGLAAAQTGRRVAGIPRLHAPSLLDGGPLAAWWSMDLDSPIEIRATSGFSVHVNQAYIGRLAADTRTHGTLAADLRAMVPLQQQPREEAWRGRDPADIPRAIGDHVPDVPRMVAGTVRRRTDVPVWFDILASTEH